MLFKFIKNACFEPQSQELKWSRIFWTFGGLGKVHEEQRWRSSKWNGISWYQTFWTLWYLEKLMYLWQHQKTKKWIGIRLLQTGQQKFFNLRCTASVLIFSLFIDCHKNVYIHIEQAMFDIFFPSLFGHFWMKKQNEIILISKHCFEFLC